MNHYAVHRQDEPDELNGAGDVWIFENSSG